MNTWANNLALMVQRIDAAIASAIKDGIAGMSRDNLRMVTNSAGIYVANANAFCRLFDEAVQKANIPRNWIIE